MHIIILLSFIFSFSVFSMENSEELNIHDIIGTIDGLKNEEASLMEKRQKFLLSYNKIPQITSGEIYEELLTLNKEEAQYFLVIEQKLDNITILLSDLYNQIDNIKKCLL